MLTLFTLDTSIIAFNREAPVYTEYLTPSFEEAWSEVVPAEERLRQLYEPGRYEQQLPIYWPQ
ncbi:MAG: hypothetical protein ACXV76_01505 [Halobacteriota archaeon]